MLLFYGCSSVQDLTMKINRTRQKVDFVEDGQVWNRWWLVDNHKGNQLIQVFLPNGDMHFADSAPFGDWRSVEKS